MSWGKNVSSGIAPSTDLQREARSVAADDPDVQRRKRINAGADPLSRNSHARPTPTLHAQDFLSAFFAYCSGERAGSFIVLFLV